MTASQLQVPDLDRLTDGLQSIFAQDSAGPITVINRAPTRKSSTYPTEIVTCLVGSCQLDVFCKYESGQLKAHYGHRGGPAYEAAVYRDVLKSSVAPTPPFYGSLVDPRTGDTWLVIGHLKDSATLGSQSMTEAARWAGRFHAELETRTSTLTWLKQYDAEYYAGWSRRTMQFAGELHQAYPWLSELCASYERSIAPALASWRQTVIHGEYYRKNILDCEGAVQPVDWESAALAAGEIDLAMLTDDWPPALSNVCDAAYAEARWPRRVPDEFWSILEYARMYVQFRWLGDDPKWTLRRGSARRFKRLAALGSMLELLPSSTTR